MNINSKHTTLQVFLENIAAQNKEDKKSLTPAATKHDSSCGYRKTRVDMERQHLQKHPYLHALGVIKDTGGLS